MAIPGFVSTLPPRREHSLEFAPALDGTCVQNCQTSWSTCINSCQWWEWVVGSCVPKCRGEWFVCLGHC
jgi:hypothetical protein